MFSSMEKACNNIEQWQRLGVLEAGYAYATRYSRNMTPWQIRLLAYEHDRQVAEVLGKPKPRRPRRPKGERYDW
jgi:hypothetical protein